MRLFRTLLAAQVALTVPVHAVAQADAQDGVDERADGTILYEAAYFAQFSPGNALQMVQRVPGFTLESGRSEVRGFAGAAGNVVINGQRPSTKSDSLSTVLARIPASRVRRIELSSGNQFGSDYVGKAQVVNLILADTGGLAGTVETRFNREYTGRILPRANANIVYRTGVHSFDASVNFSLNNIFSDEGFDRLVALPSGRETEYRVKRRVNTEPWTILALGWSMDEADDRSAHLNGNMQFDKWLLTDTSAVTGPGLGYDAQRYFEDHLWTTWEVSGDVTRPLAGGAIKLNAVANHRHRRSDDTFEESLAGTSTGGFVQDFDDYSDERLARLAWKRGDLVGWTAELGAEGAFNKLRSDLNIFDVAADGDLTPVSLPIDRATVKEYRGEAFVNAGRPLTDTLRLDLALNYEMSRLTVSGDATAERTLRFLKPKAALGWSPGEWHFQLSAERTVSQLQFGDFVSSSSFNTGEVNGGNADLQPQRKWEFLATADRTIMSDGRIKLDVGYNAVSAVQDRIPLKIEDPVTHELVNSGFDAPGNLGDGEEFIAKANLDLPLSRLGITGGRLSLNGAYLDTSVTDPYTLETREFNGTKLFVYSAGFRHDLEDFAWGIDVKGDTGNTFYRLAETDKSRNAVGVNAFLEYRPDRTSTITIGVDNLTDATQRRWRTFYTPDRTTPDPFREEYRERSRHRTFYIAARRSFG